VGFVERANKVLGIGTAALDTVIHLNQFIAKGCSSEATKVERQGAYAPFLRHAQS
jgi:hypothetical protein